jgi:glycosidase
MINLEAKNQFPRILLFFIIWGLFSCSGGSDQVAEEKNYIFGLASIVELKDDETIIMLNDYFHSKVLTKIDSVSVHSSLRADLSSDKTVLIVSTRSLTLPAISELKVWIEEEPYSLLIRTSVREDHSFIFDPGQKRYRSVAVKGEMSDWIPIPMNMIDGVWQLTMQLNPGKYQYLFVADGKELVDSINPALVSNNSGGFNSEIEIGNSDSSILPQIYPTRSRGRKIDVQLVNEIEEVFVLWQNFRLTNQNARINGATLQIKIPEEASDVKRSYVRIVAKGSKGISNDLLIPLEFGKPLLNPALLTKDDREATIMYFLMVDRFFNGNTENDMPVDDPELAPRANYYGGDLDGVLQKIEDGYFSDLGVNAVWFSPITQNPLVAHREYPEPQRKYSGYHGYWPISLTQIDHRFGDDKTLEKLVKYAHDQEISILLDFVSNHVHEDNPLIIDNPDWATQLELPDGRKNIRLWDEYRLTTWFDEFLPSLDFENPLVVKTMVDSAYYWIKRFQLDGFRHDATKHVPLNFWRELTKKLKEEKMYEENVRLFQIGETFGSRELIKSYVGSGLMDGKFDFNLYWDARAVFAINNESFKRLDYSLHQTFNYYGYQNLMGNITGNHDMPRFISYAGGDLSFDEDNSQAGWEREVGVGDPSGYTKLSALSAFLLTIPGIPVIYYGDEIGLPGANDPDSRRPMIFENLSQQQSLVKKTLKKLTHLRQTNLALIYGNFNTLKVSDDEYVFARTYFENRVIIVFNKSDQPRQVSFNLPTWYRGLDYTSNFDCEIQTQSFEMKVTVPAFGFEILTYR